jgi:putative Ca2+/H+ antiporter (TMEM165/GDT1 family)
VEHLSSIASEPLICNSEPAAVLEPEAPSTEIFQDSLLTIPSLAEQQPPSQPALRNERKAEIRIFLSTFFTIFLAELGDKTQVTTLLMSAESDAPWIVFAGAGTALVATSLIGVWLGCWLAKKVSVKTLETATGGLLLIVSVLLLWDVVHL